MILQILYVENQFKVSDTHVIFSYIFANILSETSVDGHLERVDVFWEQTTNFQLNPLNIGQNFNVLEYPMIRCLTAAKTFHTRSNVSQVSEIAGLLYTSNRHIIIIYIYECILYINIQVPDNLLAPINCPVHVPQHALVMAVIFDETMVTDIQERRYSVIRSYKSCVFKTRKTLVILYFSSIY